MDWELKPVKACYSADTVNESDGPLGVYVWADTDPTGRVSVPALWERAGATIVNNESLKTMPQVATAFAELGDDGIELYPESHRDETNEVIDAIDGPINIGHHRAGFAAPQMAYDEAVTVFVDALDHWNARYDDLGS